LGRRKRGGQRTGSRSRGVIRRWLAPRHAFALGGLRKGNNAPAPSDQQIIANCEANHGARCSSAGEIAQRRMEQRELTPSERQQQQNAVAARRQREQDEAFNRSIRR
jgi:hypothetical protein